MTDSLLQTLPAHEESGGIGHDHVGADYFSHRQLRRGAAGWLLLVGLGVAYVISGDYAGWNFGLKTGGWGGLALASVLMATMYTCMCFALAELATIAPTAGGGYGFARRAFGPWGGFLCGVAILMEYAIAPAAIVTFIGAYCQSLFGIDGWLVYLVFYAVFLGIHVYGAGEALRLIFAVTALAVVALAVFVVVMAPHVRLSNLFDIPPTHALGASAFLPYGYMGVWAAIPYAIWFFLAVEGVPLAAEEANDPKRDLPRGLIGAILLLVLFCALILVICVGAAGAAALTSAGNPLVAALSLLQNQGVPAWVAGFVNLVGLAGLIASFFSIIYGYSRLVFAMSRAGYLPRVLSLTSARKTPVVALIVPGLIGFVLSLTRQGDLLILVAVFGATISYVMMMAAHIRLRISEPDLARPYRTPGGIWTSGVALLLACLAVVAGFLVDTRVLAGAVIVYAVFVAYFAIYSRHHLVAEAPGEGD